jgi:hypothetical protein
MRKIAVFIIVLAIAFLFLVPESMLANYKGLLRAKYFLKDVGVSAKSIIISLIKGERPKEFDVIEKKTDEALESGKEAVKKEAKDAAIDAITGQ